MLALGTAHIIKSTNSVPSCILKSHDQVVVSGYFSHLILKHTPQNTVSRIHSSMVKSLACLYNVIKYGTRLQLLPGTCQHKN